MGVFSLCLTIDSEHSDTQGEFDRLYESYYKPITSWFYHSRTPFSWALSAPQMDYFTKKHGEFTSIISELVEKNLVEFLAGGYYNPVFPLIPPSDCVSQIEFFLDTFHCALGRSPNGIGFDPDIWDPKLILPFTKSGMRFVELDSRILRACGADLSAAAAPLLVENLGKTLVVLPVVHSLLPEKGKSPLSWLDQIKDYFSVAAQGRREDENLVAVVRFSPEQLTSLVMGTWFRDFLELAATHLPNLKLTTPSCFLSVPQDFASVYIAPERSSYTAIKENPALTRLYSRLLHMHLLVSQYRGDKTRKRAAAEELWHAQAGAVFRNPADMARRHKAYHHIILAEKITREAKTLSGNFASITALDFDADGKNEYICRFGAYNAFVHQKGGVIFELDVFQSAQNYADSKGCFIDHLLNIGEPATFARNDLAPPVFSDKRYAELLFHRTRKEIRLSVQGVYGKKQQKVLLNKNYIFSANAIQVQYILTNLSDESLEALFGVESCFSLTKDEIRIDKIAAPSRALTCVQLTDTARNVSILTEPNEASQFLFAPRDQGCATFHYWPFKLDAGRQIEKTITMTIHSPKKSRK